MQLTSCLSLGITCASVDHVGPCSSCGLGKAQHGRKRELCLPVLNHIGLGVRLPSWSPNPLQSLLWQHLVASHTWHMQRAELVSPEAHSQKSSRGSCAGSNTDLAYEPTPVEQLSASI